MEGLTKQQIVLVTLLVSFVTSIATGVVTATLIAQTPAAVTQTINRVVERTIEKVTPAENKAAVVTRETVVVKEDDLIVSAVDKNQKTAIRIKKTEGVGDGATNAVAGIGLVVSKAGHIVADSGLLAQKSDEAGAPIPQNFSAVFPNGTSVSLTLLGVDSARGVAVFLPAATTTSSLPSFIPASLGNSNDLKLGQTIIGLSGAIHNAVATGIISSIVPDLSNESTATSTAPVAGGGADTKKELAPMFIKTDFSSDDSLLGSLLFNLSGEVVGMKIGPAALLKNVYVPINTVASAVAKIVEKSTPQKKS